MSLDQTDKDLIAECDAYMARFKKCRSDKKDAPGNYEYNILYRVKDSIQTCAYFANKSDKYLVIPEWKQDILTAYKKLLEIESQ
jgi:hypothetical protein